MRRTVTAVAALALSLAMVSTGAMARGGHMGHGGGINGGTLVATSAPRVASGGGHRHVAFRRGFGFGGYNGLYSSCAYPYYNNYANCYGLGW
jgi:hypothetical protein